MISYRDEPNKCTSCISNDYEYDASAHTCTYGKLCHSSCETCNGPEKYNCLSCYSGNELRDNRYCISISECEILNK